MAVKKIIQGASSLNSTSKGDAAARNRLILNHSKLVRSIAAKFVKNGVPLEDLIQVGTIGLINAVDRYNPARKTTLATFATLTITGEIKHYLRDKCWMVKIPRHLRELSEAVERAEDKLRVINGRNPNISEIAEHTLLSEDDVLLATEIRYCYQALSFNNPIFSDDKEESLTLGETLSSSRGFFEGLEQSVALWEEVERLGFRESTVVRLTYLDEWSQLRIAKELGMSQMGVSLLLARTLPLLRSSLKGA